MRYILNSSVTLKWVLPEADSTKAIRLSDEYSHGVHELLAHDIFPSEIANALATAERQKRIGGMGESAIFLNDMLRAVRYCTTPLRCSFQQWRLRLQRSERSMTACTLLLPNPKHANG